MPRTTRPAKLRVLEGRGPGRDSGGRKVDEPPPFRRLPPEPPVWLEGEALAEWHRVVPELARLELLKPVDAAALTSYCLAWQRLVDAHANVQRTGHLISEERQGYSIVKRNPDLATLEAASKELRAWAAEFGLTPSAESKLTGAKGEASGEEASGFG